MGRLRYSLCWHLDPRCLRLYSSPGIFHLLNVTAVIIEDRFHQIREARHIILTLYICTRMSLPHWLVEQLDDPKLVLYMAKEGKLVRKYVDRGDFFHSLHPIYNPLIKS